MRTMIVQVIHWNFLLEPFRGISASRIRFTKISIKNIIQVILRIFTKVSLYSMLFSKEKKSKIFRIAFYDQYEMTIINSFKHVWQTIYLYSSMCIQLKWVEYYKVLESVLCLINIRVISNAYYYLQSVIQVLLLIMCERIQDSLRNKSYVWLD